MAIDSELRRSLLEHSLSLSAGAFDLPVLPRWSTDDVQAAIVELHRAGFVGASYIKPSINSAYDAWHLSGLTDRGRMLLAELSAPCPRCGVQMQLLDESVRAGAGLYDDGSWETGRVFVCVQHGKWHRLGGGTLTSQD